MKKHLQRPFCNIFFWYFSLHFLNNRTKVETLASKCCASMTTRKQIATNVWAKQVHLRGIHSFYQSGEKLFLLVAVKLMWFWKLNMAATRGWGETDGNDGMGPFSGAPSQNRERQERKKRLDKFTPVLRWVYRCFSPQVPWFLPTTSLQKTEVPTKTSLSKVYRCIHKIGTKIQWYSCAVCSFSSHVRNCCTRKARQLSCFVSGEGKCMSYHR